MSKSLALLRLGLSSVLRPLQHSIGYTSIIESTLTRWCSNTFQLTSLLPYIACFPRNLMVWGQIFVNRFTFAKVMIRHRVSCYF